LAVMKDKQINKKKMRKRRKMHIRKNIIGTSERPRLSVYRGNRNIIAQIHDDTSQQTLITVTSLALKHKGNAGRDQKKLEVSKEVGKLIAERAKEKGIRRIVFDRSGYRYHGRVKALAEGAREAGLEF